MIISCGNALSRPTAVAGNPEETAAAAAAAIAAAAAETISTEDEIPASEAAAPADGHAGQKPMQALKAAEAESPIRGKNRFLPTRRRIDREINKLKFAYKGEVMMGLTASYGTMSSDDTDIMLILDGIDADGTVATVKPFIGYFYRDNNCLGVRFGYRHMDGNLDAARYDLGESNDASGSIPKVNFNSDNYSFGIFHRSYAGLDPKGRFGLFAEFELSLSTGTSKLSYQPDTTSDNMKTTLSDNTQLKLAFNPGAAVYIFPNVCATLSFGLGGIQYTSVTQKDDAGNKIGTRKASNMRFRLNVAAINFGMTIHLWDKKKEISYDQIPENSTPCSRGASCVVVHPQRHPLSGRRTPHRWHRRPGLLGLGKQRHVAGGHPLARRSDRHPQRADRRRGLRRRHPQHPARQGGGPATDPQLPGADRHVRHAFSDLHHAFALSGLRMDDPRRADHRTPFQRDGADRRHGDRGEKPHRPGLCPRRHRPGAHRSHGTQTRSRRHHDLFAFARRTFGQQLRIGALRRRHLPRNHRTVAALRGAYQCKGRSPGNRPVEQYGHGHGTRLRRGVCLGRRAGIPHQGHHGVAENDGEQLRGRHPDGDARARMEFVDQPPTVLPSTISCRTRGSSQATPTNSD